jgi:hypothetical protein
MLYRLLPIVVAALFIGVSNRPNSSNVVDTSEAAELPTTLPRFEGTIEDFNGG